MSPKYVGFGEAVKLFFTNYVNFGGRSTRSEYWWVVLFNILVSLVLYPITVTTGLTFLSALWSLGTLLPGIGLSIRRLHDAGHSGWWILINLVPIVGLIITLVFTLTASVPANEWGEPASSNADTPAPANEESSAN